MSSGIPTQAEYERNELAMASRREREIDQQPLRDLKEAQQEFFEAMRDRPGVVAERISWLLDGNYGWGAMTQAKQVLANPRLNRRAILTQSIAVHEWMCPRRMAVNAWKKLTPAQKLLLDAAVDIVIEAAEKEDR
jgi:hypothetical protein